MRFISCFLFALILSSCAQAQILSHRFLSDQPISSLVGSSALWQNPAGLGFLNGTESTFLYRHHWLESAHLDQGGASLASNFFDALTLSLGFGFNTSKSDAFKQSDISGHLGAALAISKTTSFGISVLKSHDFYTKDSSDALISFGLQSRLNSYLALGAFYRELNAGFFAPAAITAGLAIRPIIDFLTLGIDARLTPMGQDWGDGFRLDPVFNIAGSYRGLGASLGAEIPGIKDGWAKPLLTMRLKVDFAHTGFALDSGLTPNTANYLLGGELRASTSEWVSVIKPSGLYVRLNIASDGTLASGRISFAEQLITQKPTSLEVLSLLRRIAKDNSIKGLVLSLEGFAFGDAQTQEWREEILNLKKHKKEVIVFLEDPSVRDYYIASAADKIFMNNKTTLSLRHFQATLTYFADLLAKLGIKAQAVAAGSYKTAPRSFTHAHPSKEELEVYANILNNFYDKLVFDVSKARNISEEKLRSIFDRGELTAQEALAAGLIDQMIYKDEIAPTLEKLAGKDLPTYYGYQNRRFKVDSWGLPKKIAVIPVMGEIVDGRVYPTLLPIFAQDSGAQDVQDEIEAAANNDSIAGIVLRINSPGGSAVASHQINRALLKAQKKKPVVASMGDVAASGGYLIAAGTNHILASPNTVTGSIGVFSLTFSGEDLAKKIGVNTKELSPIKNPGPTIFRQMSKTEQAEAEKVVDWHYQNFLGAVSEGLDLEKSEVKKQADGRVWLGQEAYDRKLVHELGGFIKALESIRTLAKIPADEDLEIEIRTPGQSSNFSLSSRLMNFFKGPDLSLELSHLRPLTDPYFKALKAYKLKDIPQARLPFDIAWEN